MPGVASVEYVSPEEAMERLEASYREMLTRHAAGFGLAVEILLASEGPALFHCTAGKDRTNEEEEPPMGRTAAMASATFSGVSPPASQTPSRLLAALAASCQLARRPEPPRFCEAASTSIHLHS